MKKRLTASALFALAGHCLAGQAAFDLTGMQTREFDEGLWVYGTNFQDIYISPGSFVTSASYSSVMFESFSPSWRSEVSIEIGTYDVPGYMTAYLTDVDSPGNFSGSGDFESASAYFGGPFQVDANGRLYLSVRESYDDPGLSPETIFSSGTVTINYLPVTPVDTRLTASDREAGDRFGSSVNLHGNTALVGATKANSLTGAVYRFDADTGAEVAKWTPTGGQTDDRFGFSIDQTETVAIVGAYSDNQAARNAGAAYVYDLSTNTQTHKLIGSDTAEADFFGYSVAVDGNRALVGAYRDDDDGTSSGSAYLFDTTTGAQLSKITASDAAAEDWFGIQSAMQGNRALIGAAGDSSEAGAAYLFDVQTGDELMKLVADDADAGARFGQFLAMDGDLALIGAYGDDEFGAEAGAAYLFDLVTGDQLFKFTASDAAAGDRFGTSVELDGNIAVISAYRDDEAVGAAYLFDLTTGEEIEKLVAFDGSTSDQFGRSVSIYGDQVIIGADYDDALAGSVYLHTVPEPTSLATLFMGGVALVSRRRR